MNTAEKISEVYFRIVEKCFTITDVKVFKGNNRQFDMLAYNLTDNKQYHVETSVTHIPKWNQKQEQLAKSIRHKFFGEPRATSSTGKSYRNMIQATYDEHGFTWDTVQRVFVIWCKEQFDRTLNEAGISFDAWKTALCAESGITSDRIQILSMRDEMLDKLISSIGTSNYDNTVMRMLSLYHQFEDQTKNVSTPDCV